MPIKRLTPIVPGVAQPVLFIDDKIHTGFMSGGPPEGRGFPQWAMVGGGGTAHYFRCKDAHGVSDAICGRGDVHFSRLFLPGNFARCKDCERKYTKAIRMGRQP
ncbi:MAG: hypothetical protein JWO08_3090 [Verrucomicrobiaceae bacterium]|nr:hypothetical protein [Verrucomicrobiaceae bacterium]